MALTAGERVGPYEIVGPLGAGGMGEVYRARDLKLNRAVAIKVLPATFAGDSDRLARFEREAQTLAALNHPNIAQIYGFESAANALVMELVEGEDLSLVIKRGALAVSDALPIARQIADALEAAHELGIIHRDLKPANVKVRSDGTVKVLDFGLAKALGPDGANASAEVMNSPTLTARGTEIGMILGTAAYMAPEQARGKVVDRRADIWAFGVVLFEMLSGRRAFDGEDVSTTLAAVLMKDPDWSALPASTPAALVRLIHRCLERDPKLRLRDIGEARIALKDVNNAGGAGALDAPQQPAAARQAPSRRPVVPWLVAGLGLAIAAVALGFSALRTTAPAPAAPVRFTIAYPPNVRPLSNGSDYHGASLSPDGLRVAFSGADAKTGKIGVYVRRLDAIEATLVKGTEEGRYPFWAPSSQTIAFYARGKLNRVDLDGGSPLAICDAPTGGWGGSWNADDIIVAGITDPGPLVKVSAKGGDTPTPVTTLQPGETDHDWPRFLPDGRHFVYTAWGVLINNTAFYNIASLDSKETGALFKVLSHDSFTYADPGFALFIREGTLMAQRIDVGTMALQGDAMALAANAAGPINASPSGALSYTTTTQMAVSNRLIWINADGKEEGAITEPGFYADPAISPDGSKLAYARKDSFAGAYDIWIRDLGTGSDRQLTFDPADDRSPVWSPASDEIVFSASRKPEGLYRKRANGAGAEERITTKEMLQTWPYQWHSNGFITSHSDQGASYDIFSLSLSDLKTTPIVHSRLNEERGSVSPDGQWLSYDARESARFEVFLTNYPPSASHLPVTTEGGAEAKWSKDGKHLFYVSSATGALMVVDVTPGDPPTFSGHRQVHPGPLDWGWESSHSYDIDRKTGRMVIEVLSATRDLTVLLNWQGLLKK